MRLKCSLRTLAGWTYCGVGVLKLLAKLPLVASGEQSSPDADSESNVILQDLLRWLVNRQTLYIQEDNAAAEEEDSVDGTTSYMSHSFQKDSSYPAAIVGVSDMLDVSELPADTPQYAGFNGRCNKVADTCYAFWVGGSLAVRCMLSSSMITSSYGPRC